MILATHPSYPNTRAYVLKLHRDARPAKGDLVGRLENVTTGEQFEFGSADELLACLARDAALTSRGTHMTTENICAEAALVVGPEHTARNIALDASDTFPEVFATSRMIALMEVAAARAMRPLLGDGQLSVGVSLSVRHAAATPVGARVRAVASLQSRDAKLSHFRIQAFDDAGLIGEGEHTRAVIDTSRLLAGAARRRNPSSFTR